MGDDLQAKRRNILEDPPAPVVLDEISGESSQSDAELDMPFKMSEEKDKDKPQPALTTDEKVDRLIGRMDKFFECFNIVQKQSLKNEKSNNRKFKHLETAHNELLSTVVDSSRATDSRIADLESKLARCIETNKDLTDKVSSLVANHDRQTAIQHSINADTSKKMNTLQVNQGYTDKNVLDLASEVKERKIIISRVYEAADEDVKTTALECINKVINAAIAKIHPDDSLNGLRILMPNAIDNVFRIGKPRAGKYNRNISVTFIHVEDKDMLITARSSIKDNQEITYFISDDLTPDGRALKAKLKKISAIAKEKGHETKVSGNRVVLDSRPYASNELSMIPGEITSDLKQEKRVDGGIAYRGDKSIYSNFFYAPFNLGGEDYVHVEQYFQHQKALHHGDDPTAERILMLSDPLKIKVLGDSLESNDTWKARRMKTLYEGVSAKFRQNWPLQDELLRSKGLKLYEATTDPYFACGVGFDSNKWTTMDWTGENVSGLIVMKVRDELLLEISGETTGDNTLTQLVLERNESQLMDTDGSQNSSPLESTHIQQPVNTSASCTTSSQTALYTDVVKSPGKCRESFSHIPSGSQTTHKSRGSYHDGRGYHSRGRGRTSPAPYHPQPSFDNGRGRGRGRGNRRAQRRYPTTYSRRPQDKMSADDQNFIFGYATPSRYNEDGYVTPRKTTKSPTSHPGNPSNNGINWTNSLNLTEHQKKGLVALGLLPDSDFVKNIVSTSKKV